jgi:hypothetical protein
MTTRWTLAAVTHLAGKAVGIAAGRTIHEAADRTLELSPPESVRSPRAYFLPGQLARVTTWKYEALPIEMQEGHEVRHGATRAFFLRNVWLIDGTLYKGDARAFLAKRSRLLPRLRVDREIRHGALYCTAGGNRYFGTWLMEDCTAYSLASEAGEPVTVDIPPNPHAPGYEERLGMAPTRLRAAFFRQLVVFDDAGQNTAKAARFQRIKARLLAGFEIRSHPGVFMIRGEWGGRRGFVGEMVLAQRLAERRGLRIVDPAKASVPDIVRACAGARAVVGLEGSNLSHGYLSLAPGGIVLALQPPNHFVPVYRHRADRDGHPFGFVVGVPVDGGFRFDADEVERTLDLFPSG